MRRSGSPVTALALLLGALSAGPARAETVFGGTHWRIGTPHGIVHVWRPATYEARTASTVVYVHGYYASSDTAWVEDHLPAQFHDSRRNALFVVPEAPSSGEDAVSWPSLTALLETVRIETGAAAVGPLVVVGHSGAWRTVERWLSQGTRITHLILLDAIYGQPAPIRSWLASSRSRASRLTVVAADTLPRAQALVRGFGGVVRLPNVPESEAGFTRTARQARILLLRSQYEHMAMVSDGRVLPVVLRLGTGTGAYSAKPTRPSSTAKRGSDRTRSIRGSTRK